MNCIFLKTFEECGYSVPGIKRIAIADYSFQEGYLLNSDGIILSLKNFPNQVYLDYNIDICELTEELQNKTLQKQTLGISWIRLSYDKRVVLEKLRDRRVICAFEDKNGKYWFLGEQGLTISTNTNTTGTSTGYNGYTIVLNTFSYVPMREIEQEYGESIFDCLSCKCAQYYSEFALSSLVPNVYIQECISSDFDGQI